jgi:hypothetical protein
MVNIICILFLRKSYKCSKILSVVFPLDDHEFIRIWPQIGFCQLLERDCPHRVHKTKKNKQKHNRVCVAHHYTQTNTNNVNKTWDLLQTTGGKNEPNIVFMRKSQRTSQHETQNVKTHNRTTQKLKRWATRTPPKKRGWTQVLVKGKQFLLLIRHPQCDSYIQSSMANDQCISIHTRINRCQYFSTVMIMRSVKKMMFVSVRTKNGSFYSSIWLR